MFQVTDIFQTIEQETAKTVILQGGTAAGKTWAILQLLFMRAIQRPNQVITIVGQDIPNLKKGALRDALKIYNDAEWIRKCVTNYNMTDRTLTLKNKSLIEFSSFDDEQDAKGSRRDILFVNEANGIPWEIFWQLFIRTNRQTVIDYNPTAQFWCHDKLIGKPDTAFYIFDHRANPFLTEAQHQEIEGISDPELWRVYARGFTGNLKGTIYPNWRMIDKIPDEITKFIYGIDFGYTIDPTAVVKIGLGKEKKVYLQEVIYKTGLTPENIADMMKQAGYQGEQCYCDPDVEMMNGLRRQGIAVKNALKPDPKIGILKVRQFEVYYTFDSENIHSERLRYRFVESNDLMTNQPARSPDHALDSIRYALHTHFDQPMIRVWA